MAAAVLGEAVGNLMCMMRRVRVAGGYSKPDAQRYLQHLPRLIRLGVDKIEDRVQVQYVRGGQLYTR